MQQSRCGETHFPPLGPRLVNVTNASETSTLTMDPALRASSSSLVQSSLPLFSSNASKVQSHGPGLSKASVGQMNRFYVDCSNAGEDGEAQGDEPPDDPGGRWMAVV